MFYQEPTIMKIINNMTNTHPLIVHRPGLSNVKYESREPFVKFFNSALSMGYYFNGVKYDKNKLSIITFNNRNYKTRIEQQFKEQDITVMGKHELEWDNVKKITYMSQFLSDCTTPYILSLDSDDVFVKNSLMSIIPRFESMNIDMLFGATIHNFPYNIIDPFSARLKKVTPYIYLNAGTAIFKREYGISFFNGLLGIINEFPNIKSEQGIIKLYIQKQMQEGVDIFKSVSTDYNCNIFQNIKQLIDTRCNYGQLEMTIL